MTSALARSAKKWNISNKIFDAQISSPWNSVILTSITFFSCSNLCFLLQAMFKSQQNNCSSIGKYNKSANSVVFRFYWKDRKTRITLIFYFTVCTQCYGPHILWPSVSKGSSFHSACIVNFLRERIMSCASFVSYLVPTRSWNMLDEKQHSRGMKGSNWI